MQMFGFGIKSMNPWILAYLSIIQASDGSVMVWRISSWQHISLLISIEHHLNVTAYLIIVADYFSLTHLLLTYIITHLFMATI